MISAEGFSNCASLSLSLSPWFKLSQMWNIEKIQISEIGCGHHHHHRPPRRTRDPAAEENMNPFAEQEAWEEHQIGKVTLKFGSEDSKKKHDDYEFVFEDQIEFIKTSVMDGVNVEQELSVQSPEASAAKTAFEKLQYRMPDAYDQEGGVNQEKRFAVGVQRYRNGSQFLIVCYPTGIYS